MLNSKIFQQTIREIADEHKQAHLDSLQIDDELERCRYFFSIVRAGKFQISQMAQHLSVSTDTIIKIIPEIGADAWIIDGDETEPFYIYAIED